MKHHTTEFSARRRGAALLAAIGLAFAANPAKADPAIGAFEMLVYEATPQGQLLIQGDWEGAEAMNETVSATRFAALNDRCVSLTVARDFDRAEVVCDDALRAAHRSEVFRSQRTTGALAGSDRRTNRAMAYTNRGVLRAFQGEGEGAREDFEMAVRLDASLEAAAANLKVLADRPAVASSD